MKKLFIIVLVTLLLISTSTVFARVSDDIDPYNTSLTAELSFWVPNMHGSEEFSFANLPKTTLNYGSDLGAQANFAPSVLVNYQFYNSGLTFTYDRLNFGGGMTTTKAIAAIPMGTQVNISGNSNIFGLAYDFGSKHIWGSVGFKYFDATNTVSGGGVTANNLMAYAGQPVENFFPFIGIGAEIPVVPGHVDLYGQINYSTPIIANYYDARIGLRVNVFEGLNVDAGYRTMGWGSDIVTTIASAALLTVDNGSVNYNGVYYGLSYYFY
ncbi:MAG: hypothetical protein WCV63_05075 [Negativicutes bacterium]|jgi:hypothetical protein